MSFLEKDLYFCKECLSINKLEYYNIKNVDEIKVNYNEIKNKLQTKRDNGKDIRVENLCFSGGGIKTISYIGGLQVLDDFGLLKNIKRIAASSAGTPIALLLAFKYNSNQIRDLLFKDHSRYLDRSKWSLSNLISILQGNYGLHSGKVIIDEMKTLINSSFDKYFPEFRKQKAIENNVNEYDPTYIDLYNQFNIEFITVGTNLTKNNIEYFCPRLTPNMPLYIAARISMSYPLIYEYVTYNGSVYIDSINSYPLHIFYDGHEDTSVMDPLTVSILLPTSDVNIFDRTLGFNNYNIETSKEITSNPDSTPYNYIIDLIENNNNMPIKKFMDYVLSIIKTSQYIIEKSEIRLINSHKSDEYFKHTICAIFKHIDIFDLAPSEQQRSDAVTLYKIKTLEWINENIEKLS